MRGKLTSLLFSASVLLGCDPDYTLNRVDPQQDVEAVDDSIICGEYREFEPRTFRVNPNICLSYNTDSQFSPSLSVPLGDELVDVELRIHNGSSAIYEVAGQETRWLNAGDCDADLENYVLCHMGRAENQHDYSFATLISRDAWDESNVQRKNGQGQQTDRQLLLAGESQHYDFGNRVYDVFNSSEDSLSYNVNHTGGLILSTAYGSGSNHLNFVSNYATDPNADAVLVRDGDFEEKTVKITVIPDAVYNGEDGFSRE